MKQKQDIWVSPRNGEWVVQREGEDCAIKVTDRKADAVNAARDIARQDRVDLIVQRKDGKIHQHDSYGNDPNPPKDKDR
jgi:hypothetical protein